MRHRFSFPCALQNYTPAVHVTGESNPATGWFCAIFNCISLGEGYCRQFLFPGILEEFSLKLKLSRWCSKNRKQPLLYISALSQEHHVFQVSVAVICFSQRSLVAFHTISHVVKAAFVGKNHQAAYFARCLHCIRYFWLGHRAALTKMQASSVVLPLFHVWCRCENQNGWFHICLICLYILTVLKTSSKRREILKTFHVCLSNVNFLIYSSSTKFLRLASEMLLSIWRQFLRLAWHTCWERWCFYRSLSPSPFNIVSLF